MKTTLLCIAAVLLSFISQGQTFPDRFSRVLVAGNINGPTAFVFAPDGRIFVTEQTGKLIVIKNGSLLPTPFVQLTVDSNGERGLLGVALDPNFITNGFIYLYYTVPTATIHNRISRFTANGDIVVPGSELLVLNLDNLSTATNHNGGAISFGPDGKLYVAIGENANGANAQNLDTYHGKMLRINSDGSVPAGNPFSSGTEQKKRVWSYGLRNPFTFSFQPGTGKLFVNDVGQSTKEEINDATLGGLNYGWPTAEGTSTNPTFTNPVFTYDHGAGDGKGCAITGGTFFNPGATTYPSAYQGTYFYLDLCNKWINYIDISGGTAVRSPFATNIGGNTVAMSTGPDGNVYYLCRDDKALYKILYDNTGAPQIQAQPASASVNQGQSVSFSVTATGTPLVTYQWQKDGVLIGGATSPTYTINQAQTSDNGIYKVVVSNSVGSLTSDGATLNVTVPVITGFEDQTAGLAFYPSPAREWLYVRSEKLGVESVELLDNIGKTRMIPSPEWISKSVLAIDVRSLSSGIYFLMVRYADGIAARKVVIGKEQ